MPASLPLLVTSLVVAMNISIDGLAFQPAPHDSSFNDNKRKSQICNTPVPTLDKVSKSIINDYLNLHKPGFQYSNASSNWRILRYKETGHFIEHTDRRRPINRYEHIATEIYLPPYSQSYFQGGELVISHEGKVQSIKPHPTQWTHIILPLGMLHKVNHITNGTRVSFAKSVYIRKKQENTKSSIKTSKNSDQL